MLSVYFIVAFRHQQEVGDQFIAISLNLRLGSTDDVVDSVLICFPECYILCAVTRK